ncbi:uncharacterized protein LOC111637845 [Centruroides sculpturatus]|uniref:uncharacterized protein LOC111637845 n=1 Tax=Centruroides sculpturatus TaxID=218467 RepID=UPI000C6EDE35|nr:uncharacterized protein LOC111637845 [Centruroides sculpturatus]
MMKKANELNADLIIIQEPYTINNKVVCLGQWQILYKQSDKKPKCCIGVRNNSIDIVLVPELSSNIITTVIIQNKTNIFLVNAYLSPYMEDEKGIQEIEKVISKIKSKHIIIAGDINAKSSAWYNEKEDNRGRLTMELMEKYDLISVNMTDHPTFFTSHARGWTDVCLVSSDLAQNVINCETLLTTSASDHRFISTQINNLKLNKYQIFTTKHINWDLYKKYFNENWSNHEYPIIESTQDIDRYVEMLTKDMQTAGKRAGKLVRKKINTKTHWWTEELEKQRKRINKLRKRYQRATNNEQKQQQRKI